MQSAIKILIAENNLVQFVTFPQVPLKAIADHILISPLVLDSFSFLTCLLVSDFRLLFFDSPLLKASPLIICCNSVSL